MMKSPYPLTSIVGVTVGSDLVFMWRSDAMAACDAGTATYPSKLTKPTHLQAEPMLRAKVRQVKVPATAPAETVPAPQPAKAAEAIAGRSPEPNKAKRRG
jgi:hypothetical protein